jgi:hypothetical protein
MPPREVEVEVYGLEQLEEAKRWVAARAATIRSRSVDRV